jgi:hypothetical protein
MLTAMQLSFFGATLMRAPAAPVAADWRNTHGEASASDALRHRVQTQLGWSVTVPEYRDEVSL